MAECVLPPLAAPALPRHHSVPGQVCSTGPQAPPTVAFAARSKPGPVPGLPRRHWAGVAAQEQPQPLAVPSNVAGPAAKLVSVPVVECVLPPLAAHAAPLRPGAVIDPRRHQLEQLLLRVVGIGRAAPSATGFTRSGGCASAACLKVGDGAAVLTECSRFPTCASNTDWAAPTSAAAIRLERTGSSAPLDDGPTVTATLESSSTLNISMNRAHVSTCNAHAVSFAAKHLFVTTLGVVKSVSNALTPLLGRSICARTIASVAAICAVTAAMDLMFFSILFIRVVISTNHALLLSAPFIAAKMHAVVSSAGGVKTRRGGLSARMAPMQQIKMHVFIL